MKYRVTLSGLAAGFVFLSAAAVATQALARDRIHIVGSSTVFPFSTAVAERFGQTSRYPTPIVESTGSGGGLKLFCAGDGVDTPDIANASRRIKPKEFDACQRNGVKEVIEVMIGYDGIVIANASRAPAFPVSRRQLYLALAKRIPDGRGGLKPNDHMRWSDVDPALPPARIEVLGPPPTSGTRDAFEELAIEGGCKSFPEMASLKKRNASLYKRACREIRDDGLYIDAGENDNLIVSKLEVNANALGVFGFSFLDQNLAVIKGARVDGVRPTFENIASGEYPISRSLFFYVKKSHVGKVPGLRDYMAAFLEDRTSGADGYLIDKGLIPAPGPLRREIRETVKNLLPLSREGL